MLIILNMLRISFFIAFLILLLAIKFRFNVENLTDQEKCPACFGISMCRDIDNIDLDFTDFHSIFNNLFGIKNVYHGHFKNSGEKLVMKKLATSSEWSAFDAGGNGKLQVPADGNFLAIASEFMDSDFNDPYVKVRLCPSMKNADRLLERVTIGSNTSGDNLIYFWTMLKINPEPLVLGILNAEDWWPTPKYFGACGRLVVQEFIGPPLSAFTAEPWLKRAKIASSLLNAAHLFTYKNGAFAFYLTDISMDNIAVNQRDEAIFVDLENVIIVDKNAKGLGDSWDQIYSNNIDDCQTANCRFVFSPIDMCQHKISDHNYYAICEHILDGHGGLLMDPPKSILEKYPRLKHLLKECSKGDSRIENGIKLKRLLDTITKNN